MTSHDPASLLGPLPGPCLRHMVGEKSLSGAPPDLKPQRGYSLAVWLPACDVILGFAFFFCKMS